MDHTNSLYYLIEYESSTGTQSNNDKPIPVGFVLYQNYPNPFNPFTNIKYNLAKPTYITLKFYNLAGQVIETLIDGYQTVGEHQVKWQPEGLPSGIYFCRLQAGDPSTSSGQRFTETKKLIMQK